MQSTIFSDTEGKSETDIREILHVFLRRRWLILNLVLMGAIFSSIYAFHLPDSYTAEAEVLVEQLPSVLLRQETLDVAFREMVHKHYQARTALFKSNHVLESVVKELDLREVLKNTGFRSLSGDISMDEALKKLRKMTEVTYLNHQMSAIQIRTIAQAPTTC